MPNGGNGKFNKSTTELMLSIDDFYNRHFWQHVFDEPKDREWDWCGLLKRVWLLSGWDCFGKERSAVWWVEDIYGQFFSLKMRAITGNCKRIANGLLHDKNTFTRFYSTIYLKRAIHMTLHTTQHIRK